MAVPRISEGAPLPTPRDDPERCIGQRIGPYVITGLIGHGGMGVVYRGERQQPTMAVAIKLIRGGRIGAGDRRRFEIEQEALAQLTHPGIARLYDAGEADLGDGPQP